MDESSEGASVGGFGIGPRTPLGRAVALRILVGGSLAELRAVAAAAAVRWAKAAWKLRRRPQVALVAVVALALWLRRRGAAVSAQTRARLAYRRKYWRNAMRGAVTYDEWAHAARMLEALTLTPRKDRDGELYDEELVRSRLRELVLRRQHGGVRHVIFCLRADLVRNLGNMCNPRLHKGRLQVPKLIKDYIEEVSTQLRMVCDWDSEELSLEEKLALMHETRHAFGRTALLLSGGSSLGAFHVGVVKTLVENRLLPRVVAGSSVGSVMCAIVGTRTWPDLQSFFVDTTPPLEFFDNLGGIFAVVRRVLSLGAVHETQQLQTLLRKLTSNMTFQEAFDLTGRVLGITICSPRRHEPPRLLNYLTSPHVLIWSAVTASCAFPGLFQAQELLAKDRSGELVPYHSPFQGGPDDSASGIRVRQWRDGSLESDLPMMQLKELFNVNHFIVSQANPHIAPLLRFKEFVRAYGGDFAAKLVHLVEMEVKHRCNQILELGFPMGGIAKLFAQEWEGDVTIVMPATLAQFAKIIQNPSPAELQKAIHQGRRCAWEKLSAIKANCGIELVLDECVSFLNHMRRVRRNAERAASQGIASVTRFSAGKRIPSWNCMERESSWGSLDEEALTSELAERPGGPWGGRSRRFLRAYSDASDSESENNVEFGTSWTGIGGPLMRTTSAIKFIQSLEVDIDVNKYQTYGEDAKSPENSEHYKARNIPYVSQISPRHFMCNACDSQSKQNSEKCSDNSGANDGDMEAICNCSETRIFGGSESESFSRLEVAEGDLLQPERIHSGIVFNVVKRENITMVNRDYDSGYCPHSPEFIDIDHSRPDNPSKDSYNAETPTDLYCPDKELDFSIHEKKEDPELANDDNLERPACSTAAKHNSECSLDASLKEDSEASISTDFDGLQQNKELSETVTDAGLERTTCSSVNELISEDFNVKAEHPESLPLLESELGTALVINMIGEKRDHHHVDASHTNAFGANVEDICNLDSAVGVQGACSD